MIMEACDDNEIFVLRNLYNSSTEAEEMKTLCEFDQIFFRVSQKNHVC